MIDRLLKISLSLTYNACYNESRLRNFLKTIELFAIVFFSRLLIKRKEFFIRMKRKFILPVTVFALLLSFGLAACGGGGGEGGGESKTQQSSAKQEKINVTAEGGKNKLILGETVQLSADQQGVAWSSSKPEVASVSDSGLVTSLSKGSTTIKATKDGFKDGSISITVDYETIKVTVAEGGKTSLLAGETVQLNADKQGVTWASSDTNVATVSATGLVTAVKVGTAEITASGTNLNPGKQTINVVRPDPTATLHMEDADHYTADGVWGTSYSGTMYGPGEDSPVYARSSGNASDGTCIAYMDNGDREILTFTSNVAVKAEFVMMMASRNAVSDMSSIMNVTLNDVAIDLAGKAFEGGGDTNTFVEFSFGELNIKNGENKLDFNFTGSSPYMDDLNIYAESAATITVVKPAEKPSIVVAEESITVKEGKTAQINVTTEGVTYKSASDAIATVSETGLVTGVKVGTTTINISKEGYKTSRIPVTVTEAEGVIAVSINEGTSEGDVVKFRTSQNLSAPYNYIVDEWPEGAILILSVNNEGAAGAFNMYIRARASGGYQSTTTDDLATCMEIKVNGNVVTGSGTVSGNSFTDYLFGEVNLRAGANEVTIECKTTVPTINLLRFIPKA